jgi:hypothetical protein
VPVVDDQTMLRTGVHESCFYAKVNELVRIPVVINQDRNFLVRDLTVGQLDRGLWVTLAVLSRSDYLVFECERAVPLADDKRQFLFSQLVGQLR